MSKKLYQVGFHRIKHFISKHKDLINRYIKNSDKHELSKIFGKAYYEIAIKDFFTEFKINKNPKYALQVLNIFKSVQFIQEIYIQLGLEMFEDELYVQTLNETSLKDYQKSIFFSFVYFIYIDTNSQKEDIRLKLFSHYFLHYVSTINTKTDTNLNYKDMTATYIKGKNIEIKESYKIDKDDKNVNFKILVDKKVHISLDGLSIKTLRKKAYKEIFFYLLDNQEEQKIENLALKEIIYDIHNGN